MTQQNRIEKITGSNIWSKINERLPKAIEPYAKISNMFNMNRANIIYILFRIRDEVKK